MSILAYVQGHNVFIVLQIIFDALLLGAILVYFIDLSLRLAWRLTRTDSGRMIPVHVGLVVIITCFSFRSGLGTALVRGSELIRGGLVQLLGQWQCDLITMAVCCAWLAGLLRSVLRYLLGCHRLRMRLRRVNYRPVSPAFDTARRIVRVNCVSCVAAEGISSIGVFGVLRPVILLPPDFDGKFSGQEQLMLYLHELQHIKHHDTLLNTVLQALCSVFYLHRPIRRQLALLTQYREICCDRRVMAEYPAPVQYTQLLIREMAAGTEVYSGFSHAQDQDAHRRIACLLSRARLSSGRIAVMAAAALLCFVSVNLMVDRPLYTYFMEELDTAYVLHVVYTDRPTAYEFTPADYDTYWVETQREADEIMAGIDDYFDAVLFENGGYWSGVLATYAYDTPMIKAY